MRTKFPPTRAKSLKQPPTRCSERIEMRERLEIDQETKIERTSVQQCVDLRLYWKYSLSLDRSACKQQFLMEILSIETRRGSWAWFFIYFQPFSLDHQVLLLDVEAFFVIFVIIDVVQGLNWSSLIGDQRKWFLIDIVWGNLINLKLRGWILSIYGRKLRL